MTFIIEDFKLIPILKDKEVYITGKEMLQRAKKLGIHTGKAEVDYLLKHQDKIPKNWQDYYLVFPDYVRNGGRLASVACLQWVNKRWKFYFSWFIDYSFNQPDRFVARVN